MNITTAVVTRAASGIGRALAIRLASSGTRLVSPGSSPLTAPPTS